MVDPLVRIKSRLLSRVTNHCARFRDMACLNGFHVCYSAVPDTGNSPSTDFVLLRRWRCLASSLAACYGIAVTNKSDSYISGTVTQMGYVTIAHLVGLNGDCDDTFGRHRPLGSTSRPGLEQMQSANFLHYATLQLIEIILVSLFYVAEQQPMQATVPNQDAPWPLIST